MNDGWIKLYRQSIEKGWLKNHKLWVFWCWCLLKASHKKSSVIVGYQQVQLEPGQFIFGRKKAAKELKMSERAIRTCVDFLKNVGNIATKPTNKFSIVTICNWSTYQETEKVKRPATDQQPTNNRPATDHKQEVKKVKNKEKDIGMSFCKEHPDAVKIVQVFLKTLDKDSRYRPKTDVQKLKWMECAQWAINQMGKNGNEKVIDIIEYFRNSDNTDNGKFNWADNFRSLMKLKKTNSEGVTYLDYFWEELNSKEVLEYGNQKV